MDDDPVEDRARDAAPWEQRLAVRVTKDAERHIRAGHPWVFDQSLRSDVDGRAGDLAVVFDHDRRFLAIGLVDPQSPIRIRILHQGKPTTIDDSWLAATIGAALERRRELVESADTDAFRLVHGENDNLGGLVVDVYGRNAVVKIYSEAWDRWLSYVIDALVGLPLELERIVVRRSRAVGGDDGVVVHGPELTGPVEFLENGLVFSTDLIRGHKTGHFLDQRNNRRRIGELSTGKSVLDVFACTGGFSVNAAAAGASEVTSVDISGPALELAAHNMALNHAHTGGTDHRMVVGDAFEVLERFVDQGRQFDVVVLDPPAFAHRKGQIGRALGAYRRLAALGARVTASGGTLFQASCSSRISEAALADAVAQGLADAAREGNELARTGQPVDHPVTFPEGRYLKAIFMELS